MYIWLCGFPTLPEIELFITPQTYVRYLTGAGHANTPSAIYGSGQPYLVLLTSITFIA